MTVDTELAKVEDEKTWSGREKEGWIKEISWYKKWWRSNILCKESTRKIFSRESFCCKGYSDYIKSRYEYRTRLRWKDRWG